MTFTVHCPSCRVPYESPTGLVVDCAECSARLSEIVAYFDAKDKAEREARRKPHIGIPPFDVDDDGELKTYIGGVEDHSFYQAQARQLLGRKKN